MPHAELKYSEGLEIDPAEFLVEIEQILQRHDPGSGDCKGRAYPAPDSHHRHLIIEISLLPKPHRDAAFMAALREDLAAHLMPKMPRPCWFSMNLSFSGEHYVTEWLA